VQLGFNSGIESVEERLSYSGGGASIGARRGAGEKRQKLGAQGEDCGWCGLSVFFAQSPGAFCGWFPGEAS